MQSEILEMHAKMRPLLLEAGIEERVCDRKVETLDEENAMGVYLAYRKVYHVWTLVEEIKCRLPQHTWDLLFALDDMKNSQDIVTLRSRLVDLRKTYHDAFKGVKCGRKKRNRTKENQTTSHVSGI